MGRCRELTPEERRLHVEMTCTESARTRQARRARLARVALTGPGAPRVMAELALAPEERVSDVRELDGDLYLITEEDLIDPDLRAVLVRFSMRRLYPGRDGDNAVGPRIDTPGRPITMADGYLVSARQIPGRMGSSSALHLSHVQGLNVRLLDTYEIGRISGLRIVASDPGHVVFGPVRLGTPANNFMEQFEWLSADLDAQRFERMGSLELKHRGPMHLRDGVLAITPDLLHYQIPLVPGAPMKVSLAVSGDSVEIHRLLFEHGLWHVNHQDPTWDPFRLGW